jgi:cell wall-associated NlpC family hydrolase
VAAAGPVVGGLRRSGARRRSPGRAALVTSVVVGAVSVLAALGVPLTDRAAADAAISAAAETDIPGPYLAAYEQAARDTNPPLPWEILAGVGKAATDQGRRSPYDGLDRTHPPAAVAPDTSPPIVGAGTGPLLLTPAAGAPPGADLQDVADAAAVLARAAAPLEERTWQQLGLASSVVSEPLDTPDAVRFWSAVLPQLPVAPGVGLASTPPAPAPAPAPIAAAPTGAAGPVGAAPGPPGGPLARFDADLLANLGDPVTAANLAGLAGWASGEGSTARYNPYDTTQPEPGATAFNSNSGDPVRDYPDYRTGLAATVATLEPGGRPSPQYGGILRALQAGTSAAAVDAAVAASPWGTRMFPDPSFSAAANFPGPVPAGPPLLLGPGAPAPAAGPPAPAVPAGPAVPGDALDAAQVYAGVTPTTPAAPPAPAAGSPAPGGPAAVAVAYALAQLGKPYVLGATGPAAFDCSGLVQAAWRAAGVSLPRTTYDQVSAGQAVPVGDPGAFRPGDLLFIMGADPLGGLPGHVGMVVTPGEVVDAPYTGATVRTTPLSTWLGQIVAVRRVGG